MSNKERREPHQTAKGTGKKDAKLQRHTERDLNKHRAFYTNFHFENCENRGKGFATFAFGQAPKKKYWLGHAVGGAMDLGSFVPPSYCARLRQSHSLATLVALV